jgi:hypothetical protein
MILVRRIRESSGDAGHTRCTPTGTGGRRSHLASCSLIALCAVFALTAPLAGAAERNARWTVISILSGDYVYFQERMESVGASADVNVVVLHDPTSWGDSHAYYLPIGPGPAIEIPLNTIIPGAGDEIDIASPYVLDYFLAYVQENFPADHYLLSLRSDMDFFTFLKDHDNDTGITMVDFEPLLAQFVARNGGVKIDILNMGFCLSGVADWAYLAREHADYYVGSEHTTNEPVSSYWRNYRWVYEIVNNPVITPLEVTQEMVRIFMSPAYTTYDPDEPATISVLDLSQMDAWAAAFGAIAQYVDSHWNTLGDEFEEAVYRAELFGLYWRRDAYHLWELLRSITTDSQLHARIDSFLTLHQSLVVQHEENHFRDAHGLTVPVLTYEDWHSWVKWYYLDAYGPFCEDTGFISLLDRLPAPAEPVSGLLITEVDPQTPDLAGTAGDRVELYNKGSQSVDLRGQIIDDLDDPRRGPFISVRDQNQAQAILQPGDYAVIHFLHAAADPFPGLARATVNTTAYGLEIFSYCVPQEEGFSEFDDTVALIDRWKVIDALVYANRNGSTDSDEVVNMEFLVAQGQWDAPENIATDYFAEHWTSNPENRFELFTEDFGLVGELEAGSIQRRRSGSTYSEGTGGADSKSNFVVSNETNFGGPTPSNQSFTPQPVPRLLITEIAPHIPINPYQGDMVEIYNIDAEPVDLYDIILTDLDAGWEEASLASREVPLISDEIGPGQAILEPGRMAVVICVSDTVSPQPAPEYTEFGLRVYWPAGTQFDTAGDQVALIKRDGGDLIDSVLYANVDLSEFTTDARKKDYIFDTDALTPANGGMGFVLDDQNAWDGRNSQAGYDLETAFANTVEAAVRLPYALGEGGSIQRNMDGLEFVEGAPDGPAEFHADMMTTFGWLPGVSPTPTPTRNPLTPTATPPPWDSPTPVPSASVIPGTETPPPSRTPTPSPTPTRTPGPGSPTATPAASPTPQGTPTCEQLGVELWMPAHHFTPGSPCMLQATICNTAPTPLREHPFFVLLSAYGVYYFGPSFGTSLDYWLEDIPTGLTEKEIIPPFIWPEGAGAGSGLAFYAAITNPEITEVIGEFGFWSFSFGP